MQTRQGELANAAESYQQALAIRRELGEEHLTAEPLAGLARLSLAQNNPAQAMGFVEQILAYLNNGGSLNGTDDAFWIRLTCWQGLQAAGDKRAPQLCAENYRLLQAQAERITEADFRRSFLEDVPYHGEIIRAYLATV